MTQGYEEEKFNGNTKSKRLNSEIEKTLFENFICSSDRLFTTRETAEYLRSSPKQIRKWVYQGKIKAFRLCGKSLRFKKTDIDLLLKGGPTWG
jgi:excisionase family DNA binding protein